MSRVTTPWDRPERVSMSAPPLFRLVDERRVSVVRDAAAVQIDVAHRRMLVVHQLARVLLDVDPLDADLLAAILDFLVEEDLDLTLADQRMVQLADLIALRQIGIEIILAVEAA